MANPEDLGRYRLKRLLGRGALGQVWEADDLESEGAKVAVKIMHAADEELAFVRMYFARDAELAAAVRHPNVVTVRDAGEAAGTSFMVMDMVEGRSLRGALDDASTSTADKLRWIGEIGQGLAAMHRVGLAHRDLKPENVVIRADRSSCLVDLGIAKWIKIERDAEVEASAVVQPRELDARYAPPEATDDGIYDELGDQYAWAVIAHEVLTGEVPREGTPALVEHVSEGGALSKGAAEIIDRARSWARGDRWDAMEPLLERLAAELDAVRQAANADAAGAPADPATDRPGADPSADGPGAASPTEPRPRLSRAALGAFALAFAALVFAAVAALR